MTDCNKDNYTANIVLKATFRESVHDIYTGYTKQWMVNARNIGNTEIHDVLYFLNVIFDKWVAYSTINSAKCGLDTVLHISTYPFMDKYSLVMKYINGIFNLSLPKPKLSETKTK